ncbi:N-alpha-acetyltransferase 38, NatC auxiliary subunit [[Candida] jaroonii]|uniref:N-alpha-acetyltransferase 38, NatC auxiliary subunit n=1 Tax=[Candida] jaroonii TaxID=467808 RepID=A0ACA9YGA9_9ASCO|nr:N-alpha-acetyltransferase 38, NatC auxiliary subunit [[Candida] jaroonii]
MTLSPDKFIGSQLKIQLKDKRDLYGVLTVIDPFGNLLVSNVKESRDEDVREIGLVSVPKDAIDKIFIDSRYYNSLK